MNVRHPAVLPRHGRAAGMRCTFRATRPVKSLLANEVRKALTTAMVDAVRCPPLQSQRMINNAPWQWQTVAGGAGGAFTACRSSFTVHRPPSPCGDP